MNDEMIRKIRSILEARWKELTTEMEGLFTTTGYIAEPREPMDDVDLASSQAAAEFTMRIQYRNRQLLREIRQALERIEKGEFGICEECGDDIGAGRLQAQPMTTLCVECKKREEHLERLETV